MTREREILQHIIQQGGLIGRIAKLHLNDEINSRKFLLELKLHLSHEKSKDNLTRVLGSSVVSELESYV